MQYKTDVAKLTAAERFRKALRYNRKWFEAAGYLSTGFVMANSGMFGGISPFGVAFCASIDGGGGVAAALGAVLGYIVSSSMTSNMKYIAAVVLVASAKWLFGRERGGLLGKDFVVRHNAATAVVTAFFAMLVSGAAVVFSSDYTLYDLILNLSEIMMTCGATYFFTRAVNSLRVGWNGASKTDISCIVISFAIIVTGFAGLEIQSLSAGRILSALIIMMCARYGGEAGGSIAGIIAGIAMSLSGADLSYVVAAYAFGGLAAGVFGNMGRIATAASFIIVNGVVAFLTQDSVSVYNSLMEVFVASVVFAVIPQGWMSRLRPMRASSGENGGYARGILRDRLDEIASTLAEIGATTRKVSEGLDKIDGGGVGEVAGKAVDRVCRKCPMKDTCWQFSYSETMDAMDAALGGLKRFGSLNRSRVPRYFSDNCCKLDDLLTELNLQFQSYASRKGASRKVSQVRSVVTDQFEGLSMMMSEVAEEICAVKSFDEPKAVRVRDYFEREGIGALRVQAYTDESERMRVAFTMPNYQIAKLHRAKSALDLCGLLEAEFDLPQITARKQYATVVYAEKATFAVEFGAYQIAGGGNRLCGDAYDYIKNKSGKAHFILSDGMGSGGGAAVDSSMASGLIQQLLSVGISHEAALKMVNSALMVKSGEESLATIDVTTIDLFTGRADFYKAGAAPTYVVKNGKAAYVESASMPAGILRGVTFERSVASLRENDIIVMVSDGVTATGAEWVKSELESLRGTEMQRMCEKLSMTAKSRRTDSHEDDITVLAIALRRGAA